MIDRTEAMRCDDCQDRLLDLEYGLLDPAEVAALEAHVVSCPSCSAALAAAKEQQALLARAAKSSFPTVRFEPSVEGVIVPRRLTPRARMVRWAVAAGVVLALAGTLGPTIQTALRTAADHRSTDSAVAALRTDRETWVAEKKSHADRTAAARVTFESAAKVHDEVVNDWVKAETATLDSRSMAVEVTGPASAVAGAPNDYRIRVVDPLGKTVAAKVRVSVSDSAGTVRAEESYEPAAVASGVTFRLLAAAWNDLPAGSGLTLGISAADGTGRTSQLTEPINLLPPVYTTFLATDRPIYQPGETILFRSVTLDRSRFQPPAHDLALRYSLLDGKGVEVPGISLVGASTPVEVGAGERLVPVSGPDGRPVRGVGTGAFPLSHDLAPGEYTLVVHELPGGWTKSELPAGSFPLARRSVTVRRFAPALVQLDFTAASYGPGERVVAQLTADKSLANVQIMPAVTVDGKREPSIQSPPNLDADGRATISFLLPSVPSLARAELKVTVLHGQPEVIVRPVPLALKTVGVDFYPEGGDLVLGVESRVYFRARTPDGKPAAFRGELFDGQKSISAASTVADSNEPATQRGLGVFVITPEVGKKYTLRGAAGEFALPAIKPDGVAMTIPSGVVGPEQPIEVRLAAGKGKRNLMVGAYTRGRSVATARVALESGKAATVSLRPEHGAPGGVTRVTVFEVGDDDGPGRQVLTPVAERLMFRRPIESLVLTYAVASGPAATGSPVVLNVTAKTDSGQATGAVLWAAVVSETLFGRNEDRTSRGLPAHFLICGEVEKPDDLEFADFLLTDHPKAAESLDLLLGTQGWRRFAEQAPEVFRRTAPPADADRLMVAVGTRGPVPAEFRPLVKAVSGKYEPQYQSALETVEAAERGVKVDSKTLDASRRQYELDLSNHAKIANSTRRAIDTWAPLRIPAAVSLLIVAGLICVVSRVKFRRGDAERRSLTFGALVAVGLAAFLVVNVAAESNGGSDALVQEINLAYSLGLTENRNVSNSVVNPPIAGGPGPSAVEPRIVYLEKVGGTPGFMLRTPSSTPAPPGSGSPLESAASGRASVHAILDRDPRVPLLASDYVQQAWRRLAGITPPGPASDKVRAAVVPPLVVREYAHAAAGLNRPNQFDATDTVLWKPVLVIPNAGTVDLTFGLSGATTGYRILISGHTLDGRVGTITGSLPIPTPK